MKPIILTVIACITIGTSYAQKWEIGLNGGIAWNTKPTINEIIANNYKSSSDCNAIGTLKLIYNFKKWQTGISVSATQINYLLGYDVWLDPTSNISSPIFDTWVLYNIGKPLIPITFLINRRYKFNKLEPYFGLSAGLVFARTDHKYTLSPAYNQEHFFYSSTNSNGFTTGLQIGSTYYFKKHIGINAELSANYLYVKSGDVNYKLFVFPATIGIRYRF